MRARMLWRRLARLALLLAVAGLLIPDAGVHRTTISLTKVESAKGIDFADGVVWILVLGSDARGNEDVFDGRSDAIQLVGLNLESGRAVGIGIPRDAYLDIPGYGLDRINVAMPLDGPDLTAQVVEDLVGIGPDYVFVAGFDAFEDMVDTIGGVTVEDDDNGPPQEFDGAGALEYARTRLGLVGGDFERAAHQQDLMLGILNQLRDHEDEEGFMEQGTLSALEGLRTDLPPTELYQLAQAVTQIRPSRVSTCVLVGGSLTTPEGADVIELDPVHARELGADAADNLRFDRGC
jgi:polyisoprenyl-teichoic acid--peptidoglycan teichoic acid transferase